MPDEKTNPDTGDTVNENQEKKDDWKEHQKVPYKRFEQVIRSNQEYRAKIDELSSKLDNIISSLEKSSQKQLSQDDLTEWDRRVASARHWDDVFSQLPKYVVDNLLKNPELREDFVRELKKELEKEDREAEERVNKEIEELKDAGEIVTKAQEDKLIKYAIDLIEEAGQYVPLKVALRLMKKEGKWDEERKQASKKVTKGTQSSGGEEGKTKTPYKAFRHKSLEEIVAEAKAKRK